MNWQGAEIYNAASTDEIKERVLRENFQRMGSALSKANVNLLAYIQKKTQSKYDTGGAWIEIADFSKGVTVSGGLIEINASFSILPVNDNYSLALLVNEDIKIVKHGSGANWQTTAFTFCESIQAGNMSVKIKLFSTGNIYLNGLNGTTETYSTSEMIIKEYLF